MHVQATMVLSTLIGASITKQIVLFFLFFNEFLTFLSTRGTCLYVHRQSGRDRSVMTVFALLRLHFFMSHGDVCSIVNSRIGVDKVPCANLEGKEAMIEWIDSTLFSTWGVRT